MFACLFFLFLHAALEILEELKTELFYIACSISYFTHLRSEVSAPTSTTRHAPDITHIMETKKHLSHISLKLYFFLF